MCATQKPFFTTPPYDIFFICMMSRRGQFGCGENVSYFECKQQKKIDQKDETTNARIRVFFISIQVIRTLENFLVVRLLKDLNVL